MGIFDFFTETIGVDPGSQNLRIARNGKIIFNETSQVSIDPHTNKVSGTGNDAVHTEPHVLLKPINNVIADFHGFEHLLRAATLKGQNNGFFGSTSYFTYISLPTTATQVEMRAYRDSAEHAGAKEVYMIHHSSASAIGLRILFEKKDFVLIDFSASKIEITAFADSIPISEGIILCGTWKFKRVIRNHILREYKLILNDVEAENIISSFDLLKSKEEFKVQHMNIQTEGLMTVMEIYLKMIEDEVLEVFEKIASHKRIDRILANGVYFTGGGSLVNILKDRICFHGKFKYTSSKTPLLDNINGIMKVIENPKEYVRYLIT